MDIRSRQQLLTAFRSGVDTLLLRDSSYEAFIHTLELVLDGATVLPSDLIDLLLMDPEEPAPSALSAPARRVSGDVAICEGLPLDGLPLDGLPLNGLPLNGLPLNGLPQDNPPQDDPPQDELPQDAQPRQSFGLSLRELGVLERLQEGSSNKEIARDLGITEATVKVHVKAILRKARVRNRTQVAMWASKFGVGQPQQIASL
jgi:DNA-binding NarL/FixJ family response regulator